MRLVMGGDGRRVASRHGLPLLGSMSGYRLKIRKRNDRREVPGRVGRVWGGRPEAGLRVLTGRCPIGNGENLRFAVVSSGRRASTTAIPRAPACEGGCQIRFSSVCANATARSSGMRPITRRLRPPRDHQASDRLSRRSERIGASGASLAMMQRATGAPEGST
jgi:hypothetical protein